MGHPSCSGQGAGAPLHCQSRACAARVGPDCRGGRVTKQRRFMWVITCWLLLALVPGAAFALGLGPIEVRSQRNAPLLAEIRIISSDPSELDDLRARLASPDTFARVGLAPPQGLVSNLQFAVALDAAGQPVIRVTSAERVQQSLLTFLVEVDWGQGRLVREYSALIDTPDAVAATAQPPIQAPVAPTTDAIIRPAQAPLPATPAPVPVPAPIVADGDAASDDPPSTAVAPTPVAPPPTPAPAPLPPPAPATVADIAPSADPGQYGPVQAGDTLGRIAADIRASDETLDQAMVAILRANPQAFIGDNLNLLRQGAVLRIPPPQARAEYSAAEATAVVREQVAQWRAMRTPAPLPEAVAEGSPAAAAAAPSAATSAASRVADARLEITPPAPGGSNQAGTRSGIQAGGEGDMLRQEMQQTAETLAAREAEVQELKTRVADLERLQAQQQQLIGLKDSELAAAQARLAESNARTASPLGDTGAATPDAVGGMAWLWIGLALLAAAIVGWLLLRRRDAGVARRPFNTATLAASVPAAAGAATAMPAPPVAARAAPDVASRDAVEAPVDSDPPSPAPVFTAAPSWNAPDLQSVERAPTWHAGEAGVDSRDSATVAPLNGAPGGHERIELARAYVDLGDLDTARSLLQEVAAGADPASREEAAQLLRELA